MASDNKVLSLASKAGHILLENGAEISRVEDTMERIATHYGEKSENFFVLSNGIFTTGSGYANVEFIPIKGARLDKVVEVNQLSRDIVSKDLSVEEAEARLEQISVSAPKPAWEQLLGAAFGSAGFCALFGGSMNDCLASMIAGVLLWIFILTAGSRVTKMLSNILGGMIGTALCMILHAVGVGDNLGNMIVGTQILLIPGVAFTNGMRDLAGEDYLAGTTRLLDALMVFFCIALGVTLTFLAHSWIAGGMVLLHGTVTDPFTSTIPMQLLFSLIGTSAFAILFGVPRKYYLSCGLVGLLGWLTALLVMRYGHLSAVYGCFFATILVAVLSKAAARIQKCPATVFLICGIFPMIPGGGVFWSTYFAVSNQMPLALSSGFMAVKATVAIVFGIILISNILDRK